MDQGRTTADRCAAQAAKHTTRKTLNYYGRMTSILMTRVHPLPGPDDRQGHRERERGRKKLGILGVLPMNTHIISKIENCRVKLSYNTSIHI
jgi:hypothetical protein